MVLLSMAARGCYHNGAKLPSLDTRAFEGSAGGKSGGGSEATSTAMIHVLEHTADDVAGNLVTRRYFMTPKAGSDSQSVTTQFTYDPRFLVFEYLIGFVLRKRQVHAGISHSFACVRLRSPA